MKPAERRRILKHAVGHGGTADAELPRAYRRPGDAQRAVAKVRRLVRQGSTLDAAVAAAVPD